MKRLLSLILAVLLTFSCMTVTAYADAPDLSSGVLGEVAGTFFGDLTGGGEEDEEEPLLYTIIYEMESNGVTSVYTPIPTVNFDGPGTFTITADVPLAIDYEFICWLDEDDNAYYPGDKIFVDGSVTLYAKWAPKTDDDIRMIRVIKTCVSALNCYFKKILRAFRNATDYYENFEPTDPATPRFCDLTCTNVYYEKDRNLYETGDPLYNADDKGVVFIYIDASAARAKGLSRVPEFNSGKCTVYFCTGWEPRTAEPFNKTEYTDVNYSFSEHQSAAGEELIKVVGLNAKDTAYEASEFLNDGDTYYMVVTISNAVYASPATEGRVYPIYSNPISYVFTFTK